MGNFSEISQTLVLRTNFLHVLDQQKVPYLALPNLEQLSLFQVGNVNVGPFLDWIFSLKSLTHCRFSHFATMPFLDQLSNLPNLVNLEFCQCGLDSDQVSVASVTFQRLTSLKLEQLFNVEGPSLTSGKGMQELAKCCTK